MFVYLLIYQEPNSAPVIQQVFGSWMDAENEADAANARVVHTDTWQGHPFFVETWEVR